MTSIPVQIDAPSPARMVLRMGGERPDRGLGSACRLEETTWEQKAVKPMQELRNEMLTNHARHMVNEELLWARPGQRKRKYFVCLLPSASDAENARTEGRNPRPKLIVLGRPWCCHSC